MGPTRLSQMPISWSRVTQIPQIAQIFLKSRRKKGNKRNVSYPGLRSHRSHRSHRYFLVPRKEKKWSQRWHGFHKLKEQNKYKSQYKIRLWQKEKEFIFVWLT